MPGRTVTPPWAAGAPRHWRVQRLKSTVTACQNGIWGEEPDGQHDVICVRVADFDRIGRSVRLERQTLRAVPLNKRPGRMLHPGDLLIEKSGGGELQPVGTVVLYGHDQVAICSNFVARMPVAQGYESRFLTHLHHALYGLRVPERSIKQTTGIQNLDSDQYLNEKVALPPLPEQRAIADFLDRKTAAIDALIEKKEQLLVRYEERRRALINTVVMQGTGSPIRRSSGTVLGEIPAHWHVKRLMHLTPIRRPIMYGIVLPGPNVDDGVPIVKSGNCTPAKLRLELLHRTTSEIEAGYARSRVAKNDVVYAIRGSVGMSALVPEDVAGANLTQDAARIAPGPGVNPRWLLYVVQSPAVWGQLEAGVVGATVKGINIRDLKRPFVPVPPRPEQDQIADYLDQELGRAHDLEAATMKSIDALREYRQAIITAAVTGQIDVTKGAA